MNGIQKIFAEVPGTYQFVNHLLTGGLDILWRKRAVRIAVDGGGSRWLDVCSGTGETAAYLSRHAPAGTEVFAADFSLPMLMHAALSTGREPVHFSAADADRLPFPDATFDLVTISFATRNINTSRVALERRLAEFRRVLKPGGRFVNLETSQPGSRFLRRLVHGYIGTFVRPVGGMISGSSAAYSYLSETIPRFYSADEFARIVSDAGFTDVRSTPLFLGVAAIHQGIA